jgi:hypothetical protein
MCVFTLWLYCVPPSRACLPLVWAVGGCLSLHAACVPLPACLPHCANPYRDCCTLAIWWEPPKCQTPNPVKERYLSRFSGGSTERAGRLACLLEEYQYQRPASAHMGQSG